MTAERYEWVHPRCKPDTILITVRHLISFSVWKRPISRLECVLIIVIGSSFITDGPRSPETHAPSEGGQDRDTQPDLCRAEVQRRSLLLPSHYQSCPPNLQRNKTVAQNRVTQKHDRLYQKVTFLKSTKTTIPKSTWVSSLFYAIVLRCSLWRRGQGRQYSVVFCHCSTSPLKTMEKLDFIHQLLETHNRQLTLASTKPAFASRLNCKKN